MFLLLHFFIILCFKNCYRTTSSVVVCEMNFTLLSIFDGGFRRGLILFLLILHLLARNVGVCVDCRVCVANGKASCILHLSLFQYSSFHHVLSCILALSKLGSPT